MIQAVLLDLFDTLLYYPPSGVSRERCRLVAAAGIPVQGWQAGWRAAGHPAARGELRTIEQRVRHALALADTPQPPDELVARLVELTRQQMQTAGTLYDDTLPGLAALRTAGYRLALVSNAYSYEREVPWRLGVAQAVDSTVLSCDVGVAKPEPAIYLLAAEKLGVPAEACVFVGDGSAHELSGARATGMLAVRIERAERDDDHERDRQFDHRVSSLREFVSWLSAKQTEHLRGPQP